MAAPVLPPIGDNVKAWGNNLTAYLRRQLPRLYFKTADDNPSENGVILWDDEAGYPVVSKNGAFVQIVLEDGHANFIRSSQLTYPSGSSPIAILFDDPSSSQGISKDATNPTRIVFDQAGEYLLMFSAQISSTSSSTVNFYFWAAINGTDVPNTTMKNSLHQNGATLVVSRSAKFDVNAGDYLEAMTAVDSTNGRLEAFTQGFAPDTPAATLAITRVHG
jgi:hypothetical protein